MKVLCLLFVIGSAVGTQSNFKRYQTLLTKSGYEEQIDLLEAPITAYAAESDVSYFVYTKTNLEAPHSIRSNNPSELSNSPHFVASKKTVFIIHGWVDDYTADVNTLVRAAILKKRDVNIIVVDWSPIAAESYSTAQNAVLDIGNIVGNFINGMMTKYQISGNQVTLIGHSLGAHICGNAGKVIKSKVAHIIGLDPAAPSFSVENLSNRLNPADAQYVSIVHTNGRFLGFPTSIGHVDFYPNGGDVQAGCGLDLLGTCSHARAFEYLADAIQGTKYTATLCGSYSDFQANKCSNNKKILLALDVDKSVVGNYYFNTNTAPPYSKG